MRKVLFFGSCSLALAFAVSAHQRGPAPAVPPPPMAHAAPPAAHAVAPAHPATPHASVSTTKTAATHPKANNRPTNIIVPPVSSITTTATCRRSGAPVLGPSACPYSGGYGYGNYGGFGGAYYIPVPYYYGDTSAQELPAGPEDAQQIAANDQSVSAPQEPQDETPVPAAARGRDSYINEALSEFVFVKRDGTKFNAVAYSFLNDKLQYVTKEGVRHTASIDSLDLDATQKVNEELGNTINLPTPPAAGVA
jgi:hypothetical protein